MMAYFRVEVLFGLGIVARALRYDEWFWMFIIWADDEVFRFVRPYAHEVRDCALYFGGY